MTERRTVAVSVGFGYPTNVCGQITSADSGQSTSFEVDHKRLPGPPENPIASVSRRQVKLADQAPYRGRPAFQIAVPHRRRRHQNIVRPPESRWARAECCEEFRMLQQMLLDERRVLESPIRRINGAPLRLRARRPFLVRSTSAIPKNDCLTIGRIASEHV
jgi:hypothetical protein